MEPKLEKFILALDLGTSSVGWAVVELSETGEPKDLVNLGVRHFVEVTTSDKRKVKNEERREARSMRRNIARSRLRREAVMKTLKKSGMVPDVENPFSGPAASYWPYECRAKGVKEEISLHELGRAFYHLAQRRGFFSNRGAKLAALHEDEEIKQMLLEDVEADPDESQESAQNTGEVLRAIAELENELEGRTLGEYFYEKLKAGEKVRKRYTLRSMAEKEFELLYEVQSQYHPRILTDALRTRLRHAIFWQRPLKPQKFLIGKCSLEPTKKRASKALLITQRFRIWSDLANLTLTDRTTGERRTLTLQEKEQIAGCLEEAKKMTWTQIARMLGFRAQATVEFNLTKTYKDGLQGNHTWVLFNRVAPGLWNNLDETGKRELIEIILTAEDRGSLFKTLRSKYSIDKKIAYELAVRELPAGYASLSSKAMEAMLKELKMGKSRSEAQVACGYEPWSEDIPAAKKISAPPAREDISSPRVRKALNQTRKLVNAIAKTYGRPSCIRIEMARDLSLTKKEREELEKAQKVGAKENTEANESLTRMGIQNPTRVDRIWYRLAKQCGWICPYSGKTIPQRPSATSEYAIEHIVPYELCLDDSFNNLTLCHREWNELKGKRTPYQAFGGSPDWPAMVERVDGLRGLGSGRKKALFKSENDPDVDKMVSRQLNETRWIAREAAQYLRPIADRVECTKGGATYMLRMHWGLSESLSGSPEKNRDDLRHHAVDAVAIAFTSLSTFQKVTRTRKESGKKIAPLSKDVVPPAPSWLVPRLKKLLATVVVSHETTRGILGAFHEESVYGKRKSGEYHIRKPLAKLTESEIERIVDPHLKEAVKRQLNGAVGASAANRIALALANGVPYCGQVARRARIHVRIKNASMLEVPADNPTKFMLLGNNHSVSIWENEENGTRVGVFRTMLDAARAVRNKKAKCPADLAPPGKGFRFIMWLCANDTIEFEGALYRVQKIDPNSNRLCLRQIEAATVLDDSQRLLKSINLLHCDKLEVDMLGRIRIVPEGTQ